MDVDRQVLEIRTPEGVSFRMPTASPLIRMIALFIDVAVILTLYSVISILAIVLEWISADVAAAAGIVLYFILNISYGMALEWMWRGQTIGKKLFGLRVMDERGLQLRSSQIVVRNLLRFVDSFPALYLLGGVVALISPVSQRLGDYAAGTVVIRQPRETLPDLDQLNPDRYNSFRSHPSLEARIRQLLGPEEAGLIASAIQRADEFSPDARNQLFAEMAKDIEHRVSLPSSITDVIGPEQIVRNTADTLFRQTL